MPAGMPGERDQNWMWQAVVGALALLALWLRLRGFSAYDIVHPDELMQYLEQGNRLAIGQGVVPWEQRYGARNAVIPQLLAGPMALGHWLAPGTHLAMLLGRGVFAGLCLVGVWAAWRLGALTSRRHGVIALLVAAVWWESVVYGDALLSESLGTALLMAGAALLLAERPSPRADVLTGLLLGLAVVVRLQYAVFAAVLVLAALRLEARRWRLVVLGGLAALVLGGVSDLAAGRAPYGWVLVNWTMNIDHGRAAGFGTAGPLAYVAMLLERLGLVGLLVLGGAVLSGARYRPLVLAAGASLIAHSLIGHKEYRFIWSTLYAALVLAAIASVMLADRLAAKRGGTAGAAALVLLSLGWAALSFLTAQHAGGVTAIRYGAAIPLAVLDGTRDPAVCGVALPDQWRAHMVPALLDRSVPLSVAPQGVMAGTEALPAGVMAAANALVFPSLPRGAEGYRLTGCHDDGHIRACLYRRAGGCTPARPWTYQAALLREDS